MVTDCGNYNRRTDFFDKSQTVPMDYPTTGAIQRTGQTFSNMNVYCNKQELEQEDSHEAKISAANNIIEAFNS